MNVLGWSNSINFSSMKLCTCNIFNLDLPVSLRYSISIVVLWCFTSYVQCAYADTDDYSHKNSNTATTTAHNTSIEQQYQQNRFKKKKKKIEHYIESISSISCTHVVINIYNIILIHFTDIRVISTMGWAQQIIRSAVVMWIMHAIITRRVCRMQAIAWYRIFSEAKHPPTYDVPRSKIPISPSIHQLPRLDSISSRTEPTPNQPNIPLRPRSTPIQWWWARCGRTISNGNGNGLGCCMDMYGS